MPQDLEVRVQQDHRVSQPGGCQVDDGVDGGGAGSRRHQFPVKSTGGFQPLPGGVEQGEQRFRRRQSKIPGRTGQALRPGVSGKDALRRQAALGELFSVTKIERIRPVAILNAVDESYVGDLVEIRRMKHLDRHVPGDLLEQLGKAHMDHLSSSIVHRAQIVKRDSCGGAVPFFPAIAYTGLSSRKDQRRSSQ